MANGRQVIKSAIALLTFGATIGVMTALSDAKGTVVTLLGLLFALIGGSLVSLYKGDGLTGPQRDEMFCCAGWLAGGILFGLVLGFFAKFGEVRFLPVPTPIPVPSNAINQRLFVLNSSKDTPALNALRLALNDQLKDQSLSPTQLSVFMSLSNALANPNFDAAVAKTAEVIQSSSNLQGTFTVQFESAFGRVP